MVSIDPENCPWFPPFTGNSSDNEMKSNLPEVGSLIWLLADDLFYDRYYTDFKYNISGKFDFTKVEDILGSVDGLDSTYKDIQFTLYEDQSLSFHNRLDGSHGFIQSSGSHVIIDKDGKIILNSQDDNAVRYSALETAYNELNDKFNTLVSILVAWTPVPSDGGAVLKALLTAGNVPPLNLSSTGNITGSKIESILVP
jgi:hypothetical protein